MLIAVRDVAAVDASSLDEAAMQLALQGENEPACVLVFTPTAFGAYTRVFAPQLGIAEDAATGSATGPLAAFMLAHNLTPSHDHTRFFSEQGTKMGRRSNLHVNIDDAAGCRRIEVGGKVAPFATGTIRLPLAN